MSVKSCTSHLWQDWFNCKSSCILIGWDQMEKDKPCRTNKQRKPQQTKRYCTQQKGHGGSLVILVHNNTCTLSGTQETNKKRNSQPASWEWAPSADDIGRSRLAPAHCLLGPLSRLTCKFLDAWISQWTVNVMNCKQKRKFLNKAILQRRRQISRSIASELTHELFGELLRTFSGARAVRVQKSPPLVVTRAWGRSEFERCVVKSRKQFSLWTVLKFLEAMIFSSPAGPWGVPIPPIRPFVGVELSLGLIVCERAPPLGCD